METKQSQLRSLGRSHMSSTSVGELQKEYLMSSTFGIAGLLHLPHFHLHYWLPLLMWFFQALDYDEFRMFTLACLDEQKVLEMYGHAVKSKLACHIL
jgi:hypothetical protein